MGYKRYVSQEGEQVNFEPGDLLKASELVVTRTQFIDPLGEQDLVDHFMKQEVMVFIARFEGIYRSKLALVLTSQGLRATGLEFIEKVK